ncbi:hypothetical protein HMPREF1870_01198 [Bacteroidales bacterium KA00344]|nr:hypothetical protein HMPREF1870_01198 [Bacteroidales bacterium KA00344]
MKRNLRNYFHIDKQRFVFYFHGVDRGGQTAGKTDHAQGGSMIRGEKVVFCLVETAKNRYFCLCND